MNRYSLLNRFQGAWLGTAIGKALSENIQKSNWHKIINHQPSEGVLAGEKIAQILSHAKKHEQLDWNEIALNLKLQQCSCRSEEILCSILPLVLFAHDNLSWFEKQLQQLPLLNQNCSETKESILFWSNAIALILREKLNFTEGLDSIILDVGEQVSWSRQLNQAIILSSQGKSLQEVVEELHQEVQVDPIQTVVSPLVRHKAIALAWYCFQSSPENFDLCIRRAMNTGIYYSTVVVLTGALAGAYNGMTGIPLNWRLASQNNLIYPRLEQQSQHLFAAWSGMYQPKTNALTTSIVAAAGVIQPRSSLKIISQYQSEFSPSQDA